MLKSRFFVILKKRPFSYKKINMFPCASTYHQARDVHSRALYTGPGRLHPFSGNSHLAHLDSICHTHLCCIEGKKKEKKSGLRGISFNYAVLRWLSAVTCIQNHVGHFSGPCLCSPSCGSDTRGRENVCRAWALVQSPSLRGYPEVLDHHVRRQVSGTEAVALSRRHSCCMDP